MGRSLRSFRLVGCLDEISSIEDLLTAQRFIYENEPFWPQARRLIYEPWALGRALAARFGRIYIQDRSSMLPPLLLGPSLGATVLDMCASPGSKTGFLSQLVGPRGFVLAVDASANRLGTLRANLLRTQVANVATAWFSSESLPLAEGSFDYILLDPPCSGWGTAESNPRVLSLWVGDKIASLMRLQRVLLEKAARLLAPGGRLIYSTCTTNLEENEAQICWALKYLPLAIAPLNPLPGFYFEEPQLPGVLRVAKNSPGQGFFMAALVRQGGERAESSQLTEQFGILLDTTRIACQAPLCWKNLPPGQIYDFKGKVFFLHERALNLLPTNLHWQGLYLGRLAGGLFRPAPFCRILLPNLKDIEPERCKDVQSSQELEIMLTGQSITASPGRGSVGLFFRGLSLGYLARKGQRLLWSGN